MSSTLQALGIIAGNRSLPLVFARNARQAGIDHLIAVGFEGETDPALSELVDEMVWLKVGQLGKLIETFQSRGIRQCVMLGQIAPKNLFDLRPDLRAMKVLFQLKEKNAHAIFRAIADELKKDGIELIEPIPWLKPLMPVSGFSLGAKPTTEQRADLEFGLRIAREISRLEIGQTVVVKGGTVLAVEGLEGTDACLKRGGELAGPKGGAVAVKVPKRNHDLRFDIPCIGPQTIETSLNAKIAVVGFEAERTLLLEQEAIAQLVRNERIAVLAVSYPTV